MMSDVHLPHASEWGHDCLAIEPGQIIDNLRLKVKQAIDAYVALAEGPERCKDKAGYFRVSVTIPLNRILFDQLMNGATGYRAHYSVSVESGETFNRQLVEAVAPIIVQAERRYRDKFDRTFCERSLCGRFSKFWFPKELTDLSAQRHLETLQEELNVARWKTYWRERPKPWKGLLAPIPDTVCVLLNGTFVNAIGEDYEQKPGRSKELFESGWT